MNNIKAYFFLGPPGSGKGTQIKMLAQKLGLYHFLTSKVGVEYISGHINDQEAQRQKERSEKGLLWEAEWLFNVVCKKTDELLKTSGVKGIIFDGSPRTLFEAENLFKYLSSIIGKENITVINLSVDEEEVLERIKKRLICSVGADHVFIASDKYKEGEACPFGDGVLKKREMDDIGIFKTRMEAFRSETMPAIEYLRKVHPVIEIDGDQPIEKVQKDILEKLGND